jgi:hypothetical protein
MKKYGGCLVIEAPSYQSSTVLAQDLFRSADLSDYYDYISNSDIAKIKSQSRQIT